MIATKPKPAASVDACFEPAETAPLLDYEVPNNSNSAATALPESLFYGLSFPDVPTQAPVVNLPKKAPPAEVQQQEHKSVEIEEDLMNAPSAPQEKHQAHAYKGVEMKEKDYHSISADLSALYASMEAPANHVYPSLPSLAVQTQSRDIDPTSHKKERTTNESSGDGLVQELLDENAKLSQEVLDLRASLQVLVEDSRTAPTPERDTSSQQQPVTYDSDVSSEDEDTVAQAVARTGAGVPAADSTQAVTANQTRLKYVCCGSCSQWLQAPVDKTFVYCPQCGSVNDCSSAERRNEEQRRDVQPARRLPSAPWYQQCFVRLTQFGT